MFTHELGHYGFARLFKTRVRRFYLFFNWKFSILKAKKFDGKWHFLFFNAETPKEWEEKNPENTLWGIGWIPLGGYCDIAGMIDETKGADDLESEPQSWEYRSKSSWQRFLITAGGVLVNFLSALLIYTCIFAHWGQDKLPLQNARMGYDYHEVLLDEGFCNGDIVCAVDGEAMTDLSEVTRRMLFKHPKIVTVRRTVTLNDTTFAGDTTLGEPVVMCVGSRDTTMLMDIAIKHDVLKRIDPRDSSMLMRVRSPFVVKDFAPGSRARKGGMQIGDSVVSVNGVAMNCFSEISNELVAHSDETVTLGVMRNGEYKDLPVAVDSKGKVGVYLVDPLKLFEVTHTDYTFLQAIPAGISYGWKQLTSYVSSFRLLFTKDGYKGLGGFGTLGSLFPNEWDWFAFWNITAFLAVVLAFMNIIPIPGLDGGHLLFTLWEMVTRRKPSDKFIEKAQTIGMILLLLLLVVANGNDLLRLFQK